MRFRFFQPNDFKIFLLYYSWMIILFSFKYWSSPSCNSIRNKLKMWRREVSAENLISRLYGNFSIINHRLLTLAFRSCYGFNEIVKTIKEKIYCRKKHKLSLLYRFLSRKIGITVLWLMKRNYAPKLVYKHQFLDEKNKFHIARFSSNSFETNSL